MKLITWIITALKDEDKEGLSLSRTTYLAAFILAMYIWAESNEIKEYHFTFLLIQLGYILFKDRALKLLNKFMDSLVTLRTGKKNEID